jgi:hypothetical protein
MSKFKIKILANDGIRLSNFVIPGLIWNLVLFCIPVGFTLYLIWGGNDPFRYD